MNRREELVRGAWDAAPSAERYERGRPSYPTEAIDFIAATLGLDGDSRLVDVGAGTGKLTRELLRITSHVTAVEPLAAMREVLHASVPGLDIRPGHAEDLPLPDASASAVFVAQAWHWFDGQKALTEVGRVLLPGGALVLIWNQLDTSIAWAEAYGAIRDEYARGMPYSDEDSLRILRDHPDWAPLKLQVFDHTHESTAESLVERLLSASYVSARSESEQQTAADRVRALLSNDPGTRKKARIEVPYRTELFWTTRKPFS